MYCVLKVNTTRLDGIKQTHWADILFWIYLTIAGFIWYIMFIIYPVYNVSHRARGLNKMAAINQTTVPNVFSWHITVTS